MKYRESQKDKRLRTWFTADMTRALLRRIRLTAGAFRGLNSLDMPFEFPITAIAGKNGAGKSTILAMACCAFHAEPHSYKLPKRKKSYYTFSDFFVQHSNEIPPHGILVTYTIAHNNWKKSPGIPEGIGIATQVRKKVKEGKWNDYDTRVKRTVVFIGIERIVPHYERSQSRSYSKVFKATTPKGWESKVMEAAGYILGKKYDNFLFLEHSKYSLPVVSSNGVVYSGFNMGAGENALFEIFSILYSAGDGALLVIDEIELGLHAEAQRKFIEKLKDACNEMHTQIICTTHSSEIFECLPSDARFYVEAINGKTRVTPGISSDFAFSKMSARNGLELDIYVEDDIAKAMIQAALPANIRSRLTISIIGSASALARQIAALYVRGEMKPMIAIFDGDQRSKESDNLVHAKKMAEKTKSDFDDWFKNHICYLPGDTWPEAWLLQKGSDNLDALAALLNVDSESLSDQIEYALQAGKHNEFHDLGRQLGLDRNQCIQHFTAVLCQPDGDTEIAEILKKIRDTIEQ
jgi:energy-coupling factor transporter ATP-binding protein EcfA2